MSNKYGHISSQKKGGGQAWRWAVVGLVCLWGLGICLWNTSRVAALFDYHSGLGKPAFVISGRPCYWLWKLPQFVSIQPWPFPMFSRSLRWSWIPTARAWRITGEKRLLAFCEIQAVPIVFGFAGFFKIFLATRGRPGPKTTISWPPA